MNRRIDVAAVLAPLEEEGYWETLRAADAEADRIMSLREYYYENPEWCFICSRPTDHTGEH